MRCSRVVFIEGVCGAGKTRTFNETLTRLLVRGRFEGLLALSQQYTHRMLPDPLAATEEDVLWFWQESSRFIASMTDGFRRSQFFAHERRSEIEPRFLLEGSLAGALMEYGLPVTAEAREVADTFLRIGSVVVLLTIPEEQIATRSLTQTLAVRGARWQSYVRRLGCNLDEAASVLQARQRGLKTVLGELGMHFVEVSTVDQAWETYADTVQGWLD